MKENDEAMFECSCGWKGLMSELYTKYFSNGYTSMGEKCYVPDSRCPECGNYPEEIIED